MAISKNLGYIKKNGFVNLGNKFLTADEIDDFRRTCERKFDEFDRKHRDFLDVNSGSSGFRALPLYCRESVKYLEKIITNPEVMDFISNIIGEEYKVWQIDYRRSLPGDPGLEVHQDGYGQLNMAIALSTSKAGSGGTIFLRGSHLMKKRMAEMKLKVPPVIFSLVSFIFSPLKSTTGDIALFFNRTWHGRDRNKSVESNDIILMAFYPVGANLSYMEPYVRWPDEFLLEIEGTRLEKLLNPNFDLKLREDGLHEIIGTKGSTRVPFSIEIENFKDKQDFTSKMRLFFATGFLSLVVSSGKFVKKLFRMLGLKKEAQV